MIDSHCHLADKRFNRDLDEVILRANQSGVSHIVTIADTLMEGERCIQIAERHKGVFCSIGVHPHASREWKIENEKLIIDKIQSYKKVVAIGEIGLDYYYDNSPRDVQRKIFKIQLNLAHNLNFPVVIHCRDAIEDLKRIINEVNHSKIVVHCCTESWEDVKDLVDRGFLLGFTGIATYSRSDCIREVIKNCPLEQMMVETDAPYLSPESKRGKRNEPAFVIEVARLISKIKRISFEEVDAITTKNTVEFYGLLS